VVASSPAPKPTAASASATPAESAGQPTTPVAASASGPASKPAAAVGASSVTVAPGRPAQLRCLDERVTVEIGPDAFSTQSTFSCRPTDPSRVPPPPGEIVSETIFRLDVPPGGSPALRDQVELAVTYPPGAIPPAERGRLVLAYLDGSHWERLPDQEADPSTTRVTAKIDRAGVYALYRRP
jgi:hypothetical protein